MNNPGDFIQPMEQAGESHFFPQEENSQLQTGKKSHEKRNSNPFTPVRKNKSGKERSMRLQKNRKYRKKLDMGCSAPSTVASTWPQ